MRRNINRRNIRRINESHRTTRPTRRRIVESRTRRRLNEGTNNFGHKGAGFPSLEFTCWDWVADDLYNDVTMDFIKNHTSSQLDKLVDEYGDVIDSPEFADFQDEYEKEHIDDYVTGVLAYITDKELKELVDDCNTDIRMAYDNWIQQHESEFDDEKFEELDYFEFDCKSSLHHGDYYGSGPVMIENGYYSGAKLCVDDDNLEELEGIDESVYKFMVKVVPDEINKVINRIKEY